MQNIQTEWRGHRFRSRLEARWAVAFEAMGIAWEYEPEGFELSDGTRYLPDFLLHGLVGRHSGDLWIEVKGNKDDDSLAKVATFSTERPIYLVTDVPEIFDEGAWWRDMEDAAYKPIAHGVCPFNFETVDGDHFGAFLGVGLRGMPELFGDDSNYLGGADASATMLAYRAARKARFEYGEFPENIAEFNEARDRVKYLRTSTTKRNLGYGWDSYVGDLTSASTRAATPLTAGDYDFEVIGFQRSTVRNGKNAGANQAAYTLMVSDGERSQGLRYYIPLVDSAIWKAEQFFIGIGLLDPDKQITRFPWDKALGRRGRCHVESKTWGDVVRFEVTRIYTPRGNMTGQKRV